MRANHANAIITWRSQLDRIGTGLAAFEQSSTVSAMLFGCYRCLEDPESGLSSELTAELETIKAELEEWMSKRGLKYLG